MIESESELLTDQEKIEELRRCLNGVMNLIEEGKLVRNTSGDHEPGWVFKQIDLIQILVDSNKVLEKTKVMGGWSS